MSTAVYIRVSTVGQKEASQRAEIDRWLAGHGVTDAIYFIDKKTGDHANIRFCFAGPCAVHDT